MRSAKVRLTGEPVADKRCKSLAPTGQEYRGLCFLSEYARRLYNGEPTRQVVAIVEGIPDFLTAIINWPETPVIGIESGAWSFEHARMIPDGYTLCIKQHGDKSGADYTQKIRESFNNRKVKLTLEELEPNIDLNDREQRGLPIILEAGVELPPLEAEQPEVQPGQAEQGKQETIGLRRTLGELWQTSKDRFLQRVRGEAPPIATPWKAVNDLLGGGLWPGELVALNGATGSGKSQAALQIAECAARAGKAVLYIALEMSELDALCRIGALITGLVNTTYGSEYVSWSTLWKGGYSEREDIIAAVEAKLEEYADLRLMVHCAEPGKFGPQELEHLLEQSKPDLVIIDYMQLVGKNEDYKDTRNRISEVVYRARTLASKNNLAVMVVSSIARDKYTEVKNYADIALGSDDNKKKALYPGQLIGVAKESGEVEFATGFNLVLHTDYNEKKAVIIAAKVRVGQTGQAILGWNGFRITDA